MSLRLAGSFVTRKESFRIAKLGNEGNQHGKQLQATHWNIGLWIDVAENRPRTVVETSAVVATHRHMSKQFLDARSEVGITGRGILHLI
jgi:hypothetical protein